MPVVDDSVLPEAAKRWTLFCKIFVFIILSNVHGRNNLELYVLKDVEARQEVVAHDEKGNEIRDTAAAAARIATHFGNLSNAPETMPILSFEGEPRPLHKSIEAGEVEKATKRLKNRKAVGPDELPTELLKAAGGEGAKFAVDVLNASFSKHEALGVGEGTLAAIQKPGKPKGPLGSLRPLALLSALRKTLSLVTLQRAPEKFELYLSASHVEFRKGESTSDIVWVHR